MNKELLKQILVKQAGYVPYTQAQLPSAAMGRAAELEWARGPSLAQKTLASNNFVKQLSSPGFFTDGNISPGATKSAVPVARRLAPTAKKALPAIGAAGGLSGYLGALGAATPAQIAAGGAGAMGTAGALVAGAGALGYGAGKALDWGVGKLNPSGENLSTILGNKISPIFDKYYDYKRGHR